MYQKRAVPFLTSIGCSSLLTAVLFLSGCGDDAGETPPRPTGTVTTLAGNGDTGITNGSGASASFNRPLDLTIGQSGNLFVVDQGNDRIRRVTPEGVTSSFAGSIKGFQDGKGEAAYFNALTSITADDLGNLYVNDADNYRIRKITTDGTVSTFAGSTSGLKDGDLEEATLGILGHIAFFDQDIYFTEFGIKNNERSVIRKIADEDVSVLTGSLHGYKDGAIADAQFFAPHGMAFASDGSLYVADTKNHVIRKISKDGIVTTVAGSVKGFTDGEASKAKFSEPYDVAIDNDGNIYVADGTNHRIRKIIPDGMVSTLAGSTPGFLDGDLDEAQFNLPTAIVIDSDGNLLVTDLLNQRIRKINLELK